MISQVKVNYPSDMNALLKKASETLANILVEKLRPDETAKLIKILQDNSIDIGW